MKKTLTISYTNRLSGTGGRKHDMASVPKVLLCNKFISDISKFKISEKVFVEYLSEKIIISKIKL